MIRIYDAEWQRENIQEIHEFLDEETGEIKKAGGRMKSTPPLWNLPIRPREAASLKMG